MHDTPTPAEVHALEERKVAALERLADTIELHRTLTAHLQQIAGNLSGIVEALHK